MTGSLGHVSSVWFANSTLSVAFAKKINDGDSFIISNQDLVPLYKFMPSLRENGVGHRVNLIFQQLQHCMHTSLRPRCPF